VQGDPAVCFVARAAQQLRPCLTHHAADAAVMGCTCCCISANRPLMSDVSPLSDLFPLSAMLWPRLARETRVIVITAL